jgi:polyketide biosynthesis enoyl-CoA hydratase PksH
MEYQTIKVCFEEANCFIQFDRPEAENTLNNCMIEEFFRVLDKIFKFVETGNLG